MGFYLQADMTHQSLCEGQVAEYEIKRYSKTCLEGERYYKGGSEWNTALRNVTS